MLKQSDSLTTISSMQPNKQYLNQINDMSSVKNSLLLEKISEIDESESRPLSGYITRPATNVKLPTQQSQATFRSSLLKPGESDSDDNNDDESEKSFLDIAVQSKNPVLVTELGPEAYDTDTDSNDSIKYQKIKKVDILTNDEEWDTDLEDDNQEVNKEESHDTTGRNEYKKMCENLNVVPCSYFMAHIEDQTLVLKYHQFSSDEIRAISKPLWNNIRVEKLCLDGNWIETQGVKYISRMIRQNDFITELSLTDNRVGETTEGTTEICRMIAENCVLKKLNLSGNNFSDKNIQVLIEALEKNRLLQELDLSHNNFGEESGKLLGAFIGSNDSLEVLDLSWNNFRNKGAKELALGVKENVRLKKINLSFNGFDTDGGKALAEVIKYNSSLQELNISNTRLTAECAASIANSLQINESLKILIMSNNPITTSGALAIIYAIKFNKTSGIKTLDLSEIPVIKEFQSVLKEILELKSSFICNHGLVISTSNTKSILYEGNKENKIDFEKIIASLKK